MLVTSTLPTMTAGTVADLHEKPLAESLSRFRERAFLFVEPGGNWGDGLIYLGAQTLARRLGLRWRRLTYAEFIAQEPSDSAAVYVHGGGGFNYLCSGKAPTAFLHAVSHYPGPVILGPTTVDDAEGFVEAQLLPGLHTRVASDVVMFVRERTSLAALVGRLPADIDLHLDHDTALQLTPEDALNGHPQAARYALLALRHDNEAPAGLGWEQLDGVHLDPALYARSFDHWLRIHALASRIITNRTHSSILGAILRKPTTLLGGSYHKNRSIWEYSLAPRGVRWLDWNVDAANRNPMTSPWKRRPVIGWLARSWKVQRALKRVQGVPWS